jgi:hypothetical protein
MAKYPRIKVDGKIFKLNKKLFDMVRIQIKKSISFDNKENELGLTGKDIKLLSWNAATMLFPMIQK